jgi:hypothetical protein
MAPQGLSTIPSATHFHLRSEGDSTRCALNISITFYFSCVELLVSMMPSTETRCHPHYVRVIRVGGGDLLGAEPLLPMDLIGRHLLSIPSVLDVDVDPPVGAHSGERLGSSERLGAVGEYGGTTVLMFDGPLVACVLIGENVVAVGVFHISSPTSLS